LLNKIRYIVNAIRKRRWSFNIPPPKKILIFRRLSSEHILGLFDKDQLSVMDSTDQNVNLVVLIMSVVKGNSYISEYVNFVQPRFFITYTDNSLAFIGATVPLDTIKITIQNGFRSAFLDIYNSLYNEGQYKVDYMCVFGESHGKELNKYIDGHPEIVGSIRNNKEGILKLNKKNEILFISTFRIAYLYPDTGITGDMTWGDYMQNGTDLLIWLKKYCNEKGIKLSILGASSDNAAEEYSYFKKVLNNELFVFYERNDFRNTYQLLDTYEAIVSVDSSLGYEAIARGCKVAMFGGVRGKLYPLCTRRYGWPEDLPNTGYFWSSSLDQDKWKGVVDYVFDTRIETWKKQCEPFIKNQIIYDYNNSKLISLFRRLNVPLSKEYTLTNYNEAI